MGASNYEALPHSSSIQRDGETFNDVAGLRHPAHRAGGVHGGAARGADAAAAAGLPGHCTAEARRAEERGRQDNQYRFTEKGRLGVLLPVRGGAAVHLPRDHDAVLGPDVQDAGRPRVEQPAVRGAPRRAPPRAPRRTPRRPRRRGAVPAGLGKLEDGVHDGGVSRSAGLRDVVVQLRVVRDHRAGSRLPELLQDLLMLMLLSVFVLIICSFLVEDHCGTLP